MELDLVSPDASWECLAELAKPMSTRYEGTISLRSPKEVALWVRK